MNSFLKNFKFRSLSFQLFAGFVVIMLFIIILIGTLQYYFLSDTQYENVRQLLQSRLHNIEKLDLINTDTNKKFKANSPGFVNKTIDLNVSVTAVDSDGNISLSSENNHRDSFGKHLLIRDMDEQNTLILPPQLKKNDYLDFLKNNQKLEIYSFANNINGEKFLLLMSKVGPISGFTGLLQLSTPVDKIDRMIFQQLLFFLIIASLGILLGGMFIVYFLYKILKPLNLITSTIENIEIFTLDKSLSEDIPQTEIQKLSKSFNNMLLRLKKSFEAENEIKENLQAFISNASHELRTPLTSIHGFAEVLSMGAYENEEKLKNGLQTIMTESERLSRLVNKLLLLTKYDQGIVFEKHPENLSDIIEELLPQLKVMAGKRTLKLDLQQYVSALVNKDQIKQVIINLFHNACQYTSETDGVISITLEHEISNKTPRVKLIISDNGTGIPEDDLHKIFNRFYRVEQHRSRKTGGDGLGLSIVKAIVDNHDGEISVQSKLGEGAFFIIHLKCFNVKDRV